MSNNNPKIVEAQATVKPYVAKEHEVANTIGKGVTKGVNIGLNLFGKGIKLLAQGVNTLDQKVNK